MASKSNDDVKGYLSLRGQMADRLYLGPVCPLLYVP